jgi:predicted dehydrogenase
VKAVGVGVIGTGFGQIVHIPGLIAHPHTEVVAVYHRNITKANQVAEKFQIPYACDRLEDLFSIPKVEAVTISTPPFLHYIAAKAAIAAGKHILLEKPMTMNVAEAISLYHLAAKQNVVAAMDFEFRVVPEWRYFKHLLDRNFVGKKRLITIDWLVQGRADPKRAWNWYSQKSAGGGALGALGSHSFDYISWLFGPVQRLCGHLSTAISERPHPDGGMRLVDADDTCNILLELEDGTPCNLRISTVTHQGCGHWVTVYGDRATLVLSSSNKSDYVHGFEVQQSEFGKAEMSIMPIPSEYELPQIYPDGRLAPFIAICDRFVKAIRSDIPMIPNLREGVYSQLMMDLTHQSHNQEKWVDVPDLDSILRK